MKKIIALMLASALFGFSLSWLLAWMDGAR